MTNAAKERKSRTTTGAISRELLYKVGVVAGLEGISKVAALDRHAGPVFDRRIEELLSEQKKKKAGK